MESNLTEFSYGYAVTDEIVNQKIKIRKYILNLQYSMDLTELNKCR